MTMSEPEGTVQAALDLDMDSIITVSVFAVAAPGDTDTVVHNLQTKQNYRLNDTGSRIWELLEAGITLRSLVAAIMTEYQLTPEVADQVREDAQAVISSLKEYGLVDVASRMSPSHGGS
jgi:hypothetical protein